MAQVPHTLQFFNGTAIDSAVGFTYFSTSSGLHRPSLTNFTNSNFSQTKDIQFLFFDTPAGANSFTMDIGAADGVNIEIAGPNSVLSLARGATLAADGDVGFDHLSVSHEASFGESVILKGGATISMGVNAAADVTISSGYGDPNTQVVANPGSLFLRLDGGANTTLYVKESGIAEAGWVAK